MSLFFAKVSWKTLWGCSKGGKARCWDCFLGQNDLMALASFNFIALTHKTVVNSGTCGKFIFVPDYISYLCEILLHICPEITFCNLRCDNQANFPPQQYGLDKCHFDDEERLGFPDHPIDADHITSRLLNDEIDTWNDKCYIIWPRSFDIFDITYQHNNTVSVAPVLHFKNVYKTRVALRYAERERRMNLSRG